MLPRLHPQQADNRIFAQLDKLTHAKRVKSGDAVTSHLVAPAKLPDGTELQKEHEASRNHHRRQVAPHLQQNDADALAAGNPFSGQNRTQAGTATNTLNSASNEVEALPRIRSAHAPASHGNVATGRLQPGKSYLLFAPSSGPSE